MKRICSICLIIALIFTMAGCGSSTPEVKPPAQTDPATEQTDPANKQTDPTPSPVTPDVPDANNEVTIEETVLLDEEGVKITAKGLDTKALFGPEIKLLLENESGKNLTVQCRNLSVNGYMIEPMMSVDVVSGKKANDTLTLMESALNLCGIKTLADLEFSFHIFETDSFDTYMDTDRITLKTSAAEGYHYTFDDSGDVAYEGNDIKIVIKGLTENDSIFGPSIIVYIENNSGRDVTVQTRDVSVNGFMVDPIFSCDVCAGKHAVSSITFLDSELEDNDIEEITDTELSFHVYDFDAWDTVVDTDVVRITF